MLLAIYLVPSAYLLLIRQRPRAANACPITKAMELEPYSNATRVPRA